MFDRIVGVFRLDKNVFEDIEHDVTATSQALLVVLLVALLTGLGNLLFGQGNFFGRFISTFFFAIVGWLIWAFITYFVGTRFFGGQADINEMLRVTGFAYAPQMLGIIPCIGWLIGLVWMLAAMFVAIRQGLDLDDSKTLVTIVVAAAVYIIGFILISIIFGLTAAVGSLLLGR